MNIIDKLKDLFKEKTEIVIIEIPLLVDEDLVAFAESVTKLMKKYKKQDNIIVIPTQSKLAKSEGLQIKRIRI